MIVPLLYIRTDADTCRCLQSVSVPLRQALLQDEVADENEPAAIPEEVWADLQEERNLARYSVPVPFVRQNSYKWGGCAIHPRNSLQAHLTRSGPQRGMLFLRCARWWRREAKQRCWHRVDFPAGLKHLLPQHIKEEMQTISMSFARSWH